MAQLTLQQAFDLALRHHGAGHLKEAAEIYRHILTAQPRNADALHLLGLVEHQSGRNAAAADLIRQALAINPNSGEAQSNLGNVLRELGDLEEAIAACRRAAALLPDSAEAHGNLGSALRSKGQLDEAITAYRRALVLKPDVVEALNNLAGALHDTQQLDEAVVLARRAMALAPQFFRPYNTLGNVLKDQGQVDEAIAAYRQAIALKPDFVEAHSNLLFTLHFSPSYGSGEILAEAREWNRRHAAVFQPQIRPHANAREPGRRLRIGYVSPDFRQHCQAFFMLPLLSQHDHQAFEIFCYSDVQRPDALTRRIAGFADTWRPMHGQSDAAVAEQIRADKIDILVDLTMHMGKHRLLVFARKPAPVQVSWLAYPGTTGLDAIDYRITDPQLDPPDSADNRYAEKSLRLPETFWCYDPLSAEPQVNSLPALTSGVITFGSLNNYCKVNAQCIELWSQVLTAVKHSRLMLLSPQGDHRPQALTQFSNHGINPERITWFDPAPRYDYLAAYHHIDIGLDTPFPYNGHTTSLDSFWMGVPVITLPGPTVVGRAGVSQLQNLGLGELIARSAPEFTEIAANLSADLPRLAELRRTLRGRMQASPLMDSQRFARHIEAAYREMWKTWCRAK